MTFCATRSQFALGWFGGGNSRRFARMALRDRDPLGVLAVADGEPVGWVACGPRSRYPGLSRDEPLTRRPVGPRDWIVPCLFLASVARGRGVSHLLVGAAVALARKHGAAAVEAYPVAASTDRSTAAFTGREQVFVDMGFRAVDYPTATRVVVRLELAGPP